MLNNVDVKIIKSEGLHCTF